jgi:mannose-6-phosphate isomerase-like protein (cupin superfamily)
VGEPVLVQPRSGEIIGDTPGRRVEILADQETLNATWSRFGPHQDGADLHVHRQHTDLFYVLSGDLTVRLGIEDELVVVPAGTLARIPPDVVHGFRNDSDAEVSFLNLHAPGERFADYLRAMRDGRTFTYDQHSPPADGGRPRTEAVIGGSTLAGDGPGRRVTLLTDVDEIAVAELEAGPVGEPEPPHVHLRHDESFYVLEGEIALTVGSSRFTATAGSWVQVPRGVPHRLAFPARARYLDLHTPGCGFGRFLRNGAVAEAGFDQEPAA